MSNLQAQRNLYTKLILHLAVSKYTDTANVG